MNYDRFVLLFSIVTLCVLFSLMFMGGYVSSSGVGLSCPDWPLCPHGLVPSAEFLIEYSHRTLAASTGLVVLLTMVFVLKSKNSMKSTRVFSIIAATIVFGQIALGGTVITERLHAVLVTAHLGLGLMLYSSLLFVVVNTYYTNLRLKSSSLSSNFPVNLSASGSSFNEKKSLTESSSNKSPNS